MARYMTKGVFMGKGKFTVHGMDCFRLHAYCSNDPFDDASYIVEGEKEIVVLEYPLFRENAEEFQQYMEKLGKPVCASIQDYHLNGYQGAEIVMAEGMPQFMAGQAYSGMMQGFAKTFADAITPAAVSENARQIRFGQSIVLAGVPFRFERGAATDFPAAGILIGGQVYYTHWTPVRANMSPIQLGSREAVKAELDAAEKEQKSGATVFIGGHGGVAEPGALQFKIRYLETIEKELERNAGKEDFVEAVRKAWPSLAGEENLKGIADNLYG